MSTEPSGSERELIEHYFHKGFEYERIVCLLEQYHSLSMNVRTLKRRLQTFGLKRRNDFNEDDLKHIKEIINHELQNGPESRNGYRTIWHILRLRYHINVPRKTVASLLREIDPHGVESRKQRVFRRRTYTSAGPNFCWHLDGYDKLKTFGFSIHACVDGFSRRIIWIQLQRSNKDPKVIAKYFLTAVENFGGCPARVYSDHGTENGIIAGMQCYLRSDGIDEFSGSKAHKYVPSTSNQRIECFWSSFRKQRAGWWIDFFNDLHESDILDLSCDIHKEALWFCFADLLEMELEKMKEYWNTHKIRKSKYAAVAGCPDIMYFLPEEYGFSDCLCQVSSQKLIEMKSKLEVDPDEVDPIWEEYFHYVMERNGLMTPNSVQEAGALFQTLVSYAKPK